VKEAAFAREDLDGVQVQPVQGGCVPSHRKSKNSPFPTRPGVMSRRRDLRPPAECRALQAHARPGLACRRAR